MRSHHKTISNQIEAVYFDGKRHTIFTISKNDGKASKKKTIEEHISQMSEPNSEYIGHFTPESVSTRIITTSLLETWEEKGMSLNELSAVGCDGTVSNTGTKGGIRKLLVDRLGRRPL